MRLLWIFAAALVVILVWGLDQIAVAPLETGEIYPQYSSLRTDPDGAKALYESLAAMPGLEVERLYKDRKTMARGEAMFVLGVNPVSFSAIKDQTIDEYEKLVENGGRLIFAFLPLEEAEPSGDRQPLEQRWQLRITSRRSGPGRKSLAFEPGPAWTKLSYGAIERKSGEGSIALVPYSFPLSNQGLRDTRDAAFLSALVGSAHRVLFDENHFGVVETGSVTKLMRQYHLQSAIAVLAIVAALFLWRSGSSFLPPRTTPLKDAVAGRESIDGLSALLRRGVPEADLLDACFAEWSKSARRDDRMARIESEIASAGKRDPVNAYRAASRVLTEKK